MPDKKDKNQTDSLVEGEGSYEYLGRCIAIVTLLYERGILEELVESGRIDPAEIDQRLEIIQKRYPVFAQQKEETQEPGAQRDDETGE